MRNKLAALFSIALIFLISGCADPCEKAHKKAESCFKKQKGKPGKSEGPRFLQLCKMNRSAFSKCLKITDCTRYQECISKAGTDPKALEEFNKKNPGAATEPAMAPAPAMTAEPAMAPTPAMTTEPAMAPVPMTVEPTMAPAPAMTPMVPAAMK